jgi:hypothetical protein
VPKRHGVNWNFSCRNCQLNVEASNQTLPEALKNRSETRQKFAGAISSAPKLALLSIKFGDYSSKCCKKASG